MLNISKGVRDHGDRAGKPFCMIFLLIFSKKLEKSNHGNFTYFCLKTVIF